MSRGNTATIRDIKYQKAGLERAIAGLLLQFTKGTDMKIERVNITTVETLDGRVVQYVVEIEATL